MGGKWGKGARSPRDLGHNGAPVRDQIRRDKNVASPYGVMDVYRTTLVKTGTFTEQEFLTRLTLSSESTTKPGFSLGGSSPASPFSGSPGVTAGAPGVLRADHRRSSGASEGARINTNRDVLWRRSSPSGTDPVRGYHPLSTLSSTFDKRMNGQQTYSFSREEIRVKCLLSQGLELGTSWFRARRTLCRYATRPQFLPVPPRRLVFTSRHCTCHLKDRKDAWEDFTPISPDKHS
ncbi:hypothetical protein Bbelb_337300 [Branchiostoma belcheri]|nr:hypothetical protein Bbelb_337300 [Branchiostoma belcheri]